MRADIVVLLLAALVGPASGWLAAQPLLVRPATRARAATPLLREVDVTDLPLRPPMGPGLSELSEGHTCTHGRSPENYQ